MASADAEVWVKVVKVPGDNNIQDVLTVGFPKRRPHVKVKVERFRELLEAAGYERAEKYEEVDNAHDR